MLEKKVGDAVKAGEPLLTMHVNDDAKVKDVTDRIHAAYSIGAQAPAKRPLVLERLG